MSEANIIQKQDGGEHGRLRASAYSILGHRESQQDFAGLLVEPEELLAVVCDGMGGLRGGERASQEAVRLLVRDYLEQKPVADLPEFFCQEARSMDREIWEMKDDTGKKLNAGSTVVSVAVREGKLFWLSVGDSRIYLLRKDSMVAVTKDHNYRQELTERLERGEIDQTYYDQEIRTKRAEALTSYLGMGGLRRMERNIRPFQLEDGDIILLCSDGVYKSLDEAQIKALLLDNRVSTAVTARRIARMALQQSKKRQDNTTAVVIQYFTPEEEPEDGALL